ncbi:MAG TPA: ion channel [Blastocatellia bacterium]|jgi:inward rectifier potassium channel|nr:ion channel [Blastocatellia bacterium]
MSNKTTPNVCGEDANRDLGFGAVVAGESRQRLLNRDGSFNVSREGLSFWASLSVYHSLLTMPWWKFLTAVTASYVFLNVVFAVAYILCGPDALENSVNANLGNGFARAFFFSVETFATIGYGNIAPVGLAPNVLVTIESLFGLLGFALATGLLFARFSRPTAQIIFSRSAIIAPYRDVTAFEFRITNARRNQIIELEAKVLFARFEKDGGHNVRRFYPLALERERVTFFPLSWTIVHPITEASPLYGLTREDLLESNSEFLILLTGIDETFSQTVHTRSSYQAGEVVWDAKFSDVFNRRADAETLTIDVRRLHLIERVGSPAVSGDATRER